MEYITYEGVSLHVATVKGMNEKKFMASKQMRALFQDNEEVMQGAYRTITGKNAQEDAAEPAPEVLPE